MPKEKAATSLRLRTFVNLFGSDVFSSDGDTLRCKPCDKTVVAAKKSQVEQHINTKSHADACKRTSKKSTLLLKNMVKNSEDKKQEEFNYDICRAFVASDIALKKIEHPSLRDFFKKYTPSFNIPSERTVRRQLQTVYDECLDSIRSEIGDNPVYVVVDETTDFMNRYVCSVLIGSLTSDKPHEPFLVNTSILQSVTGNTVAQAVNDALMLWNGKLHYERVLLLLTDAASYMTKMGTALKLFYPNMIHVTCLAHALHRVAETIRLAYPNVNRLIAASKQIFSKSPMRRTAFATQTSLPLPPQPIVTRWGTWLESACYYAEHFEEYSSFVSNMETDAACIAEAQSLLSDATVKSELLVIATHFKVIASSITKLETSGLPLRNSLAVVETLKENLTASGECATQALEKLKSCLSKNTGFAQLKEVLCCMDGETSSVNGHSISKLLCLRFAPTTSVDVERSFSQFKAFFQKNRSNFSEENLNHHLFVHFNSRLVLSRR